MNIITVKNAEGEVDTQAQIIIQNKIDYTPKVSVIIPVYNTEEYLRECMDSVINQTLKEIEIVCVDDGSTDGSLSILKEYAARDSRFIILRQKNMGAGIARNSGIETAKGEFLAFLDSDDYYDDNTALGKLYQTAISYDILVASGLRRHLKMDGQIIDHPLHRCFFIENDATEKIFNYADVQYDYHYHCYIFSKKIIDASNLRFPAYKRFQDPPFFVKAMFFAKQFVVVPVDFYVFRESERGRVPFDSEKTCDLMRGLNDNLEFSSENNLAVLHYVTAKRFLEDYFFSIADNLSAVDSGIVEILFKASSLLNPKLIEDAEKVIDDNNMDEILTAMEVHSPGLLPQELGNYINLPGDDKVRLTFLARVARERIIFNNEKWHFIHENEKLINENKELADENKRIFTIPLFKDIGLGCDTWSEPSSITVSGNVRTYTYDLSDNIYTHYVSWDPIKEGSCDVEILRLSAVEKRSKRVVEFPVDRIISSGKISGRRVEFRNQKGCWIGCTINGAYESFTVEAEIRNV